MALAPTGHGCRSHGLNQRGRQGGARPRLPASSSPWSSVPRQKNSSQARDIFAAVTQVLGRSSVDFWGAELLAGQDEGAFGWITVNYGLGTLVKVPQAAQGRGLVCEGPVSGAG